MRSQLVSNLVLGVNNHRATSTGEDGGNVSIRSRNLTGLGEVMSVSSGVSQGSSNMAVGFTMPVSSRNTSLQLYASDSDSSLIEARLKSLDIESLTQTRGLRLSHPFVDKLDQTLFIVVGL